MSSNVERRHEEILRKRAQELREQIADALAYRQQVLRNRREVISAAFLIRGGDGGINASRAVEDAIPLPSIADAPTTLEEVRKHCLASYLVALQTKRSLSKGSPDPEEPRLLQRIQEIQRQLAQPPRDPAEASNGANASGGAAVDNNRGPTIAEQIAALGAKLANNNRNLTADARLQIQQRRRELRDLEHGIYLAVHARQAALENRQVAINTGGAAAGAGMPLPSTAVPNNEEELARYSAATEELNAQIEAVRNNGPQQALSGINNNDSQQHQQQQAQPALIGGSAAVDNNRGQTIAEQIAALDAEISNNRNNRNRMNEERREIVRQLLQRKRELQDLAHGIDLAVSARQAAVRNRGTALFTNQGTEAEMPLPSVTVEPTNEDELARYCAATRLLQNQIEQVTNNGMLQALGAINGNDSSQQRQRPIPYHPPRPQHQRQQDHHQPQPVLIDRSGNQPQSQQRQRPYNPPRPQHQNQSQQQQQQRPRQAQPILIGGPGNQSQSAQVINNGGANAPGNGPQQSNGGTPNNRGQGGNGKKGMGAGTIAVIVLGSLVALGVAGWLCAWLFGGKSTQKALTP